MNELHEKILSLLQDRYGNNTLDVKRTGYGNAPVLPVVEEQEFDSELPAGSLLFGDMGTPPIDLGIDVNIEDGTVN